MIFRKKAAEKLFRVDMIRFLKLADIIQYSVIAFVFALLIGTFINKNMPSFKKIPVLKKICHQH